MSDDAKKRLQRSPARAACAAAGLLVVAIFAAQHAGAQTATPQRKTAPGPTGKLAGQVLGEDGKPAAKANVYCQSSDGRTPRAARADAQGHFRLTCPSGPVDVRASSGDVSSAWIRNLRIRTGETTTITIHIAPSPESGQEKKDKPSTPRKLE